MRPRVLDLFAGVGGFSLGFHAAGFETVAFSEIEPFPCAVLERRFPGVPNLGDVSKITAEQIEALGKIDVVTFGSPCQDFSVAGKRLGMKGQRSSLFHEAVRVIRHARPRFAVWENVPGVFSSAGGWDFAAVLDEMAELGALDVAWAVLDAQFFGVPQRRRRVFVVADFAGERAGEILLESEGVSGNPQKGREARQEAARGAGGGAKVAGFCAGNSALAGSIGYQEDMAPTVRSGASGTNQTPTVVSFGWQNSPEQGDDVVENGTAPLRVNTTPAVTHALTGEGFDTSEDGTGRGMPLVTDLQGSEVAQTLRGFGHGWQGQQNSTNAVAIRTAQTSANGHGVARDRAHTLDGTQGQAVAFAENQRGEVRTSETHPQLTTGGGKPGQGFPALMEPAATSQSGGAGSIPSSRGENVVPFGMAVRRLTPLECERLMGWTDGWTDVPYRGKPAADGPRYRACGNGVVAPVVEWIARRMRKEFA